MPTDKTELTDEDGTPIKVEITGRSMTFTGSKVEVRPAQDVALPCGGEGAPQLQRPTILEAEVVEEPSFESRGPRGEIEE
jgi:hypothetical protein